MKVKELMEALSKCDPEAIVAVPYSEYSHTVPLEEVIAERLNIVTTTPDGNFYCFSTFPATNPMYANKEVEVVSLWGQE